MDPKIAKAALEALKNGDTAAALALVEQLVMSELTDADEGAAGEMPPADAGATAENADAPPPDPNAPPPDDKQKQEMAALSRELVTLSGRGAGDALAYFRELHATAAQRAADAATLESGERRALVAELVKLGVEVPATAWQRNDAGDIPEGDDREPVARLAGEPIADLRSRVTVLRAARGQRGPAPGYKPPATQAGAGAPSEKRKLTKTELDFCKKNDLTEDEFRARVAGAVKRSK